jgi:copper homeostasis protein
VLNSNKTIDVKRTKELVELSKPLAFTFHRAFDEVVNAEETLLQLIDLGVERVLTSGQEISSEKGLELLQELSKISNNRITILAGGGISSDNASKFKDVGLKEIHASASTQLEENNSLFSLPLTYSDPKKIEAILNAI